MAVLAETEPPFDRKEAARRLGVSIVTVDRLVSMRRLACYRVGRRVLIGANHIANFLESNQHDARRKGERQRD